jgi:hypothetical protein
VMARKCCNMPADQWFTKATFSFADGKVLDDSS